MQSDLPLRVAFPVFIGNLLRWLAPPVSDGGGQVRAGTPYPLYLDNPLSHITVQDPEGRQQQYEVQGNPWIFTDTQRVGVYTLRAGDTFKRYLTVNLLDGRESDINAADRLPPLAPGDAAAPAPAGSAHTPLWLALALGAVGILSAEWFAWCRDF